MISPLKEELVEGPSPLGNPKARRSLDTNSQASDDDKVKKRFGGRKSFSPEEVLKKRLNTLYKAIYDFQVRLPICLVQGGFTCY